MCTSNTDDHKLENTAKQSRIRHLGELHKEWTEASQCIKSRHAQTSSGKGLPSHFWNRNSVRSILPGIRRKITGLLLSGPKSSFQIKVHFAFHLEIKVWSLEEDWRGTESMLLVVQCEVSKVMPHLTDAGVCAKGAPTKYWVHTCTYFKELELFCFANPFFFFVRLTDLRKCSNILRYWIFDFQ